MKQPKISSTRRKPNNLLFQSPKLEFPKRTDKGLEADRPPTPYPISMERWKSSVSFDGQSDVLKEIMVKKRKIIGDKGIVTISPYLISFPSLGSGHSSVPLSCDVSPMELMRASESILNQVDWSEVVLDVIGKESPAIFKDAFKKILQVWIDELLKQEYKQETENMKEPDIESADDIVDWLEMELQILKRRFLCKGMRRMSTGAKGTKMTRMRRKTWQTRTARRTTARGRASIRETRSIRKTMTTMRLLQTEFQSSKV